MRDLLVDDAQPAEPAGFVCTGPQRSILLPKALYLVVLLPVADGRGYRVSQILRQLVFLCIDTHACTPAVLPVTSSSCANASANSLTPSTTSLSVISFMEMPTSAKVVIVRSALATSSVKLGRSLPCARNASNVAGGIVSTVSAPMSS